MPKLKTSEFLSDEAWDELENTEYSDEPAYEKYKGEQPPEDTVLSGYFKKLWWTETAAKPGGGGEDPMIVSLWISDSNEGDEKEYDGLPIFSYWPLVPGAKFRWAPAFEVMGFSLRDVRNNLHVVPEGEEDNTGIPITKVGKFTPGEENDAAWCRVLTEPHEWDGVASTKAQKWLPWDATDEAETEDTKLDDAIDPDMAEDMEEETAPTQAPRGRGAGRSEASARTGSKSSGRPAKASTPSAPESRRSSTGKAARGESAPVDSARKRRGRASADVLEGDEPPF